MSLIQYSPFIKLSLIQALPGHRVRLRGGEAVQREGLRALRSETQLNLPLHRYKTRFLDAERLCDRFLSHAAKLNP